MNRDFVRNLKIVATVHFAVLMSIFLFSLERSSRRARPPGIALPVRLVEAAVQPTRQERTEAVVAPTPAPRPKPRQERTEASVAPPTPAPRPKETRRAAPRDVKRTVPTVRKQTPKWSEEQVRNFLAQSRRSDRNAKADDWARHVSNVLYSTLGNAGADEWALHVYNALYSAWEPPSQAASVNVAPVLRIWLNADGGIARWEFSRRSGDLALDESVAQAVGRVRKIEGLSAEFLMGRKARVEGLTVEFSLAPEQQL